MRVLLLLLPSLGGGVGVGGGVGLTNEVDLRNGLVLPYNMRTRVAPHYNLTFPCPTFSYHAASPNSVHKLRPQDIGIIASLGDSITAGTGEKARNIVEVLDENRGSSYMSGADGDWLTCPSIHNFLKQYNPGLRGGSRGSTRAVEIPFKGSGSGERGLNLSLSGAVTADLPDLARDLVRKIQQMPGWKRDWKLVSILMGHNDLCSKSCLSPFQRLGFSRSVSVEPGDYQRHMAAALDILSSGLPRTLVLLLAPAQVTLAQELVEKPKICQLAHSYLCPCLFDLVGPLPAMRQRVDTLWRNYRWVLSQLSQAPRYNRQDFTVELLSTVGREDIMPTVLRQGRRVPDIRVLAPDCFHFTKELHGRIARNLWNNLLQPVGARTLDYSSRAPLKCPDRDWPYLSTKWNSV